MRHAEVSSTLTVRIGATLLVILLMLVIVFGLISYTSTSRVAAQTHKELAHLYVNLLATNEIIRNQVATDAGKVVATPLATATLKRFCKSFGVNAALFPSYTKITTQNQSPSQSVSPNQQTLNTLATKPSEPRGEMLCGNSMTITGANLTSVVIKGVGGGPRALLVAAPNIAHFTDQAEDIAFVDSLWAFVIAVVLFGVIYLRIILEVKRASFGLSPAELTGLLQEQEALLYGISEGVIGCDQSGRVRFFNKEAKELLGLPDISFMRPLSVLVRGKRLKELLTEVNDIEHDSVVVLGEHVLVVNNIKVEREGVHLGSVVTIKDITEWENLLREFDGMVGMTEALRAQAHEFSNKLHVIVGLIGLGYPQEAMELALDLTKDHATITAALEGAIDSKTIVALLLAKSAIANEKGVALEIDPVSELKGDLHCELELLTILGNLIDNSIEELSNMGTFSESRSMGWITVKITSEGETLKLIVSDSGRGVPIALQETIFMDGFSTKASRSGARRGLGLALVKQIVEKHKGEIRVTSIPGACFEIILPGMVIPSSLHDGLVKEVVASGDHT